MDGAAQSNRKEAESVGCSAQIEDCIRQTLEEVIRFCREGSSQLRFAAFEQSLLSRVGRLFRLLVALFLAVRHEQLDIESYLAEGRYRLKDAFAVRGIKTLFGSVKYGRHYLLDKKKGGGWFPLDAELGITRDGFSPLVISLVTRLATRVSYATAALIFRGFMGWSPSTEAIGHLALGLGRRGAAYMQVCAAPQDEGEVLVIEIDGKATPTATEAELAKRRGSRKKKGRSSCSCGCQRHRGRENRKAKRRKRRRKGDKSKNGRSVTLVVMYTLKRGEDGLLHGPINKRVWGTYAKRKVAFQWARDQATKRGFPPDTGTCVQIVIDGEKCLRDGMAKLFPEAILTLDLRHAQEKLWLLGRQFHPEGSAELEQWVEPLNTLLLAGKVKRLLAELRELQGQISKRGPGTKSKRTVIQQVLDYLEPRVEMMRYDQFRKQDLVLASGVVEGAARYVVGERLDCSGMRWIRERAEPLLHLRCIELNGDWDDFFNWVQERSFRQLRQHQAVQIRIDQPMELPDAA